MKQYINNRKFYDIQKLGQPFTFGLKLSYLPALGTAGNPALQPFNLSVPLFATGMFNSSYSEITQKWGGTTVTTGNNLIGIGGILNSPVQYGGAISLFFPRNSSVNSVNIYNGTYLQYIVGTGDVIAQNYVGQFCIVPTGMDYVNFLNYLWKTNLLCTNVNVQITQKGNDKNYLQNQWTFFDQKINGEMYTETTALNRFINPQTNVATTNTFNNIDIPCDWVVTPYSGISVGFNALFCDDNTTQNGRDGYQLNFTFQEIIK